MKRFLWFFLGFFAPPVVAFVVYLDSTRYDTVSEVVIEDTPEQEIDGSTGEPIGTPPPSESADCSGSRQLIRKGDIPLNRLKTELKAGQVHSWRISGPEAIHDFSSGINYEAELRKVNTAWSTHTGTLLSPYWATLSDCPGQIVEEGSVCSRFVVEAGTIRIRWGETGDERIDSFYCEVINDGRPYYFNVTPASSTACPSGKWCGYLLPH